MNNQRFKFHDSVGRFASLTMCFSLFLILISGSVSSSSHAYADDMMGMPSPQDAPATTDTLTAGGGSDSDDDDDNDSDDDSGGSRDDDNDDDNEPIPKDAPATTDALTAKKLECPTGQEVGLFSTSCGPTGAGSDSTQGSAQAATACAPTSPTPSSYGMPDRSSLTNTVWGSSEAEAEQGEMQKPLMHKVQSPTTESKPADPMNCPPTTKYEPPASALPYRGNERDLIAIYANPDPTDPFITSTAQLGTGHVQTLFGDGTIKRAKTIDTGFDDDPSPSPSDIVEVDVRIIPGSDTSLARLGVVQVDIPGGVQGGEEIIKYGDGKYIKTLNWPSHDDVGVTMIDVEDSKGKLLESFSIIPNGRVIFGFNYADHSHSRYNADGSYITTWPKKADGSQQFYDSKQQKVFVRDAKGNIIPPKE